MTFIFMVHLSCYAIPLLIYDVMYGITTIPWVSVIIISKVIDISCNGCRNVLLNNYSGVSYFRQGCNFAN